MTGIYGIFGDSTDTISDAYIPYDASQAKNYVGDVANIINVTHDKRSIKNGKNFVTAISGLVWIDGEEIDLRSIGEQASVRANAQLVHEVYMRYGNSMTDYLNGEFLIIIIDKQSRSLTLFTDQLGTRQLYYTKRNGSLVFSSHIQTLVYRYGPEINLDGFAEFTACQRVYGTHTPVEGVFKFPPGSVISVKLRDQQIKIKSQYYWRPEYKPVHRKYSDLIGQFWQRLITVIKDVTDKSTNYGMLLSAGSDSRLILAILRHLNRNVTAYHINTWYNREAQVAKKVADELNTEFRLLKRDENYVSQNISTNANIFNFKGKCTDARLYGFKQELKNEDMLISGWTADTFFKGHFIPEINYQIQSLDEFLKYLSDEYYIPEFINTEKNLYDILCLNSSKLSSGEIIFHGIRYRDFSSFMNSVNYYPLTNQDDLFFHNSLRHISSSWIPFLDNRLVNFHTSISQKYQSSQNIIKDTIQEYRPRLHEIPYNPPNTSQIGFSLAGINIGMPDYRRSETRSDVKTILKRKLYNTIFDRTYSSGAWMEADAIRDNDFVSNIVKKEQTIIKNSDSLDINKVNSSIQNFNKGNIRQNHGNKLYMLITFLEMPSLSHLEF